MPLLAVPRLLAVIIDLWSWRGRQDSGWAYVVESRCVGQVPGGLCLPGMGLGFGNLPL